MNTTAENASTSITLPSESDEEHTEPGASVDRERRPAILVTKRSCNNCRQQKLRCDVIQEPFSACSRCRRLKKECTVDMEFKRVGKRDKYAKMQREIDDLKRQLKAAVEGKNKAPEDLNNQTEDVVPALSNATSTSPRRLGERLVSGDTIDQLYKEYFTFHHPFLPFLNTQSTPDSYFHSSPLLGWSIAIVGSRLFKQDPTLLESLFPNFVKLIWSTIADMPHSYHVAKALCLICFWQLLNIGDFKDPTFQLSGIMIQIGIQNMLHLPVRTQQTPYTGKVTESDIRDRLMTWVACNIVGQNVSIIYGLPPQTTYDWVLGSDFAHIQFQSIQDLTHQLEVAQFCNHFTKTLYCNSDEPTGLVPENDRVKVFSTLCEMHDKLAFKFRCEASAINEIYLLASCVHLHKFAFLIPRTSPARDQGFVNLYDLMRTFLRKVMAYETSTGHLLEYTGTFISQTILNCIFALLRLLNSSFQTKIDIEDGKALFNSTLLACRAMMIQDGDAASRSVLRIPKVWRERGAGGTWDSSKPDPLVLKIPFRMSASHVYDGIWTWREAMKSMNDQGAAPGETATRQTEPTMATDSYDIGSLAFDGPQDGFDIENIDFFNSMDWAMDGWPADPTEPFDFGGESGFL